MGVNKRETGNLIELQQTKTERNLDDIGSICEALNSQIRRKFALVLGAQMDGLKRLGVIKKALLLDEMAYELLCAANCYNLKKRG
ncbi:MAG: hypothetical protein LBG15_06235 [Dysgonamonadaceae bacterium]|jgi:hypothetical protein|nr:hypothetical protein [Dysgonamonadaceae bacterium]